MQIFFSYASPDEKLAQQFLTHISTLTRQQGIHLWHQGKLLAGVSRQPFIMSQLQSADIILLFITPDFLSSATSYSLELQQALARHQAEKARLVPILVRPVVSWENHSLGELQVVPKNGKPVTTWRNRDEAWVTVARQIEELLATFSPTNQERYPETQHGGLSFVHIVLDQRQTSWWRLDQPGPLSLESNGSESTYALCDPQNPSDPLFDITLLNSTPEPLILTRVGIEIIAVAHPSTLSIRPQATKIVQTTSYQLPMPDILAEEGPFEDELTSFNKVIALDFPDPIYLPSMAPYRYGLALLGYCQRMPQEVLFRMWIQTNAGSTASINLHLSLIH